MKKIWTQAEVEQLIKLYPDADTKELAKSLNCTIRQLQGKAYRLGIKKTPEYLSIYGMRINRENDIGAKTRFKNGSTPWNKGIKRVTGNHPNSRKTQFKKGGDPHNTRPIGSYRIDKHGTLQQKINNSPGSNSVRWRSVHELVWIEANGPVPPKHIVIFKPGMKTNNLEEITIDRVECISLAENMRRNTIHNYPKEIVSLTRLQGSLNRMINDVEKQNNQ